MTPDAIAELQGLQALARSLVHGDSEADDLIQDAAIATLEHPPPGDRPLRGWLAVVIRNRWKMNRRAEARRRAREELAAALPATDDATGGVPDSIDRARVLQRLGDALVALEPPLREVVVRRYLDGRTAAQIARELGIPAGTVRWRLKTGLERLREALDRSHARARWMRALVPLPLKGVAFVKAKTKVSLGLALLALLLVGGVAWFVSGRSSTKPAAVAAAPNRSDAPLRPSPAPAPSTDPAAAPRTPTPGQARATLEPLDPKAPGVVSGRVINWSTGAGVRDAELTFSAEEGAYTVRSEEDGKFELAPPHAGELELTTISAKGFLPFAPEYLHSSVRVQVVRGHAVRGVTVFVFPAIDYHGLVVENGKPVANAHVRLLATPAGEQQLDHLATEWTTDAQGTFTFHAADDAILEATAGDHRGWGRLDGNVAISKQLVISIGPAPARDATITGKLVDKTGAGLADALVRADPAPDDPRAPRSSAFAVTGSDGAFELRDLDQGLYVVTAEAEDHAPVRKAGVAGGTKDVKLVANDGVVLAGTVTTTGGDPVPEFTLLVFWRKGVGRRLVVERSIVDARGHFEVRVDVDAYEVVASAPGWAPSPSVSATAPARDLKLVVSEGATLSGTVVSSVDHQPVRNARVMPEGHGGGASVQPANAGTVTREDGTFELTGIAPGPLSIMLAADQFNPKIEAGFTAADGAKLGPVTIELVPLADGEAPKLDLVGIGVQLSPDGDALHVDKVFPGGGAAEVGITDGESIVAIEGTSVVELGMDGAIARIRGQPNTMVAIGLRRGDKVVTLAVPRRKLHV